MRRTALPWILAGATVAIPPAFIINTALFLPINLSDSSLLTLLGYGTIPGIVEEGIKGLILLVIFRSGGVPEARPGRQPVEIEPSPGGRPIGSQPRYANHHEP